MREVLDDADYLGDAQVTSGAVNYAEPMLTWTGALAVGESVTLTYSVRINGNGDGRLDNTVASPSSNCATGPAALATRFMIGAFANEGSTCRTTTEVLSQAVQSPITADPIPVTG